MSRFCSQCGKAVSANDKFCAACGALVEQQSASMSDGTATLEPKQDGGVKIPADFVGPKVVLKAKSQLGAVAAGTVRIRDGLLEVKGLLISKKICPLRDVVLIALVAGKRPSVRIVAKNGAEWVVRAQNAKSDVTAFFEKVYAEMGTPSEVALRHEAGRKGLFSFGIDPSSVGAAIALLIFGAICVSVSGEDSAEVAAPAKQERKANPFLKVEVISSSNIREGPGTEFEIVGTASVGEVFRYEKKRNGWYKLEKAANSSERWMNQSVVRDLEPELRAEKQKEEQAARRQAGIERQFSGWDGSHKNLERVIKESMNDPDSYEHVKTMYWDRGDSLKVVTTFRGKNAFGGVVMNSVGAIVDLDGNIISVEEYQ